MSTQRTTAPAGQAGPSPVPPASAPAANDAAAPTNETPEATAAPEAAATEAATEAAHAVQDGAPAVNGAAAAAAGAETYGAAAASLVDPACRPGTAEFATAKASNGQLLSQYRATHDSYKDAGVRGDIVLLMLFLLLL